MSWVLCHSALNLKLFLLVPCTQLVKPSTIYWLAIFATHTCSRLSLPLTMHGKLKNGASWNCARGRISTGILVQQILLRQPASTQGLQLMTAPWPARDVVLMPRDQGIAAFPLCTRTADMAQALDTREGQSQGRKHLDVTKIHTIAYWVHVICDPENWRMVLPNELPTMTKVCRRAWLGWSGMSFKTGLQRWKHSGHLCVCVVQVCFALCFPRVQLTLFVL